RRVRTSAAAAKQARMNRLYVVETSLTSTGAKADHRLAMPASEIEPFARALASWFGVGTAKNEKHGKWIATVAKDLEKHKDRSLVLAGDRQPTAVHLLAHALNQKLGNLGHTVIYTDPIAARPVDQFASLRELADDMAAGHVELLVILGGNPVFTAPVDL